MKYYREIKKQVKAEAKAFKKDARKAVSCASMMSEINTERKAAEKNYNKEMKDLRRCVMSETAAYKAAALC